MKIKVLAAALLIFALVGCTLPLGISILSGETSTPLPPTYTLTPEPTTTPTVTPTPIPSEWLRIAEETLYQGDFNQAIQNFQNAYDRAPDSEIRTSALFGLARAYYQQDDCSSTLGYLDQLIQNDPNSQQASYAVYYKAKCQEFNGDHLQAADSYAQFRYQFPGILDAYLYELEGDARSNAEEYSGAILAYQSALASIPAGDSDSLNLKIGQSYLSASNYTEAIRAFLALYDSTQNDYTKATANLLAGQAYIALGLPDQAYARFQDSVLNFPRSYDAYTGLVQLVNDGIPVDDLSRGIVDYYAGQYGYGLDAITRFISNTPETDATPYFYRALCLRAMEQSEAAISDLDFIVQNYSGDRFWAPAWDEKAYTQWVNLGNYRDAAQTLLDFVARVPDAVEAPQFLFDAGRIQERGGLLGEAALTWGRLINEYPSANPSYRALFLSAVTNYRLGNLDQALLDFQRLVVLATDDESQSGGHFWIGKTQQTKGETASALSSWETAATLDPTGYYGIRSVEKILNQAPLTSSAGYDLGFELEAERDLAEDWLRTTFNIPTEVDLDAITTLEQDAPFKRGSLYWNMGEYQLADAEFEELRLFYSSDAMNSFRLLGYLVEKRMTRAAVFTSRQILSMANMSDESTLSAPVYFNHIRFGPYFRNLVLEQANNESLDPLVLFSLIRQESMFNPFAGSSAGARGLMQLMPATGAEIAGQLGWTTNYTDEDLWRAIINIRLGSRYLARQRDYFDGDLFSALAAYNAGPGNVQVWRDLAGGDPDLFLEIIRFEETRNYLTQIVEFNHIYQIIYNSGQ
jgi:soluble lytic murein transglycosylase